jgi:hypothetical protein
MSLTFQCPNCRAMVQIADATPGQSVVCTKCGARLKVPATGLPAAKRPPRPAPVASGPASEFEPPPADIISDDEPPMLPVPNDGEDLQIASVLPTRRPRRRRRPPRGRPRKIQLLPPKGSRATRGARIALWLVCILGILVVLGDFTRLRAPGSGMSAFQQAGAAAEYTFYLLGGFLLCLSVDRILQVGDKK